MSEKINNNTSNFLLQIVGTEEDNLIHFHEKIRWCVIFDTYIYIQ